MNTNSQTETISSKELMARTGISRATLNNYISLKLIPPPTVRKPEEADRPTKMGYFPLWVLDRLARIKELKDSGMRLSEIAAYFTAEEQVELPSTQEIAPEATYQSIEQIVFPAMLVNQRWEIIWINEFAEDVLFRERVHEIPSSSKRNVLRLFLANGIPKRFKNWEQILLIHLRLAKRDLNDQNLEEICREVSVKYIEKLRNLWLAADPLQDRPITQQKLKLQPYSGQTSHYSLFSCDFREGTLLLYSPANMQLEQILNLLMGRERLIKTVLAQRIPSLTPLCLVAGRLESTIHLRTALPPQEYFDLVNQVTLMAHRCFQAYGGTPGRSFHEGVVCFFLSAPNTQTQYLFQGLHCAQALQKGMNDLDKRWRYRKSWDNTLRMSISIHCAHEWLGTIPSSLAFEFTVMGDSLMESIKLCKFAENGAIWASKKVIENLLPAQRQLVKFGIRRALPRNQVVSPGIYSRVRELLPADELDRRGLREIGNLAVTEIFHIESDKDEDSNRGF